MYQEQISYIAILSEHKFQTNTVISGWGPISAELLRGVARRPSPSWSYQIRGALVRNSCDERHRGKSSAHTTHGGDGLPVVLFRAVAPDRTQGDLELSVEASHGEPRVLGPPDPREIVPMFSRGNRSFTRSQWSTRVKSCHPPAKGGGA